MLDDFFERFGDAFSREMEAFVAACGGAPSPLTLHDAPTGRLIQRFPRYERVVHWLTAGTFLIPASAAAATTVDTTAASIISVQIKRSGSTAETIALQELLPFVI